MEASGLAVDTVLQTTKLQPDRLSVLLTCLGAIRRCATLSITGVTPRGSRSSRSGR
jgi:hypothetical protein